ncbi:amidase [Methylobacter luteus]|uniref:amidase n=1 Tax=Methylobacter luteus TaxID=415 RepID=UPI0003FA0B6C|nr:amidase [Methylobacter luteus]
MSGLSNYQDFDALGLAELVRTGHVSSQELLHEARTRLHAVNPTLNAVICSMDSLADSLVAKTDLHAPFCGVPFLVKDLRLPFAGYPLSNGSNAMKRFIPDANSGMADRIIRAGLVVFGKTNTSELGASSLTAPAAFGETRNPWNPKLNSGGSSGGSSAAVAARVVPMAYSSDGGGSIRFPASYCGIFGFKPSRGLNRFEDLSKAWGGAVVSHVSTLSVRDSAAYLDVMVGNTDAGYSTLSPPEHSSLHAAMQTPPRMKIGLITQSPTGTPVHADCISTAEAAAKYCEQLGHHIGTPIWGFDGSELMRAFLTVVFRYTARDVTDMARLIGMQEKSMPIELNTRFMATVGSGIGDERVAWALDVWKKAASRMSELHNEYDVILTPTVATPPLPSNALDPNPVERLAIRFLASTGLGRKICSDKFLDSVIQKSLFQTPYTPIANMTGQPAMSVPLYWDRNNLPHGAHFMAAEGNDRLLFQLAGQLETAHPWRSTVPNMLLTHHSTGSAQRAAQAG